MDRFLVTAGYVTVETELPGGSRANIDVPKGTFLPADVPQAQIDWELQLNTIERVRPAAPERAAVPEPVPSVASAETSPDDTVEAVPQGLSVSATLTWAGTDKARAQAALDAETAEGGQNRSTLIDRLGKVIAAE